MPKNYNQQDIDRIRTLCPGWEVVFTDSVDSTNTLAKSEAPAYTKALFVADVQTAGRGRFDRTWFSEPGSSCIFSLSLRTSWQPEESQRMSIIAAVCVCRALRQLGFDVGTKWPNDIVYHGKKVGGILIERIADSTGQGYFVVGVGINVATEQEVFPAEIADTAVSLCKDKDQPGLRIDIMTSIVAECDCLITAVPQDVIEDYRSLDILRNKKVVVLQGKETLRGIARGIAEDGSLIFEKDGGSRVVLASGEITLL